MNKIKLEGLDEEVVHETLDNGLNIYVLRKKEFNEFSCYFITNYGGLINEFVPINEKKMHKFPKGIAHFLEHKLFEQEKGPSVLEKFSSLGGICNAFTNYKYTTYYVTGVENLKENLLFLIDYVQSPYFTDENVKKEQGIIDQERLMTLDNPYKTFHMKMLENVFVNYEYGKTILGEKEDIYNITKEDLYKCYNTFYNPSNMCLLVVSNEDEKKIISYVKENQESKKFEKLEEIKDKKIVEEERVKKEYDVIYDNVTKIQIGYSYKISTKKFKIDIDKVLIYLNSMLNANFGKISEFNLDLKKKKLIDRNLNFAASRYDDYIVISIIASSDDDEKVINLIEKKLKNIDISEEIFDMMKKTLISRFVYYFSSIHSIMNYLYDEYYDNRCIKSDSFIKCKELNFKEYKDIIESLKFDNISITIMKPLEKKE